jgi:peptide/nickel transport system permease protein
MMVSVPLRDGAAGSLRTTIRASGFCGLGLIAIVVSLCDSHVIARVAAGAEVGPALAPPSAFFQFGTDHLGRDMFSETLHALAVTVDTASIAMLVTIIAGGLAGFVSARLPWRMGYLLRWIMGVLTALPALFLALLWIELTGRGYAPLYAGLAASPVAFARAFDRASALGHSAHADYARATGVSPMTLLRRDLTYEFRAGFLSAAARALAAVAIILSTVSFLGFGSTPPNRDLGLMISEAARENFVDAWWTVTFPAIALALLILFARLAAGLEEGERP